MVFYKIQPVNDGAIYDRKKNLIYKGDEAYAISRRSECFQGYQVPFYRPSTSTIVSLGTENEEKLHEKTHVCDVELGSKPNTSVFGFEERSHNKVPFYKPRLMVFKKQSEGTWSRSNEKKVYLGKKIRSYYENHVCDVYQPIYHRFSRYSPQSLLLLSCRMGVRPEDGSTICSVCGRDHLR